MLSGRQNFIRPHTLAMRRALAALALLVAHVEAKPIVNVCSLFPKWTLDGSEPWGTGSGKGKGFRRLAILQAALQSINSDATLLPNTTLQLIHGDSRCDQLAAMAESTRLVQRVPPNAGCDVIIGAACSSASKGVATVSSLVQTPQISYSSTSPDLSDSAAYPYLMRVAVSDTLQSTALAGPVRTRRLMAAYAQSKPLPWFRCSSRADQRTMGSDGLDLPLCTTNA